MSDWRQRAIAVHPTQRCKHKTCDDVEVRVRSISDLARTLPETMMPSIEEYQSLFGASPLSASKREAIRNLFAAGTGLDNMVLVDGVEEEL